MVASPAPASPVRPDRDADFSRQVLERLYSYPWKRRAVAWLLWLLLGWAGGHRFYLNREFTGLAMLFTGGGGLLWWTVDAFLVDRMVVSYNADQALRRAEGRPPRELDAMPPLADVRSGATPGWVTAWRAKGRARKGLRLAGDALVLLGATAGLGGIVAQGVEGALEAGVAVVILAGLTAMGAGPGWVEGVPVVRGLQRWVHQLRLFYLHNPPGPPLLLLIRPVTGALTAPFQARARAEVRLYVELGAVFTALFLLVELVPEVVVPAVLPGRSVAWGAFVTGWLGEVVATFFFVYAFATPVGAVLTRHLLLSERHVLPRILAAATLVGMALGGLGAVG